MRSRILEMLRHSEGGYLSGEEIASRLGVSRTAVWKHIGELRAAGYNIVSQTRSGYALKETPDRLLPEEVRHGLHTELVGKDVIYFESTGSTNAEAKRLARQGAEDGTVVVAESQESGRGRLERSFFCPKGGIWFSVILRPDFLPQEAPKCTLLAAVAVASAMEKNGWKAGIKWPNDIIYEGRKLVGILTEMSAEMDRINYIVIGTGINANIPLQDFPAEIRNQVTSLSEINGMPVARVPFLQTVLERVDALYHTACREGFATILQEWKRCSVTLGQEVKVIEAGGGECFTGVASDIDEDGALLVDTETGRRRVLAGDVSIRPVQ